MVPKGARIVEKLCEGELSNLAPTAIPYVRLVLNTKLLEMASGFGYAQAISTSS